MQQLAPLCFLGSSADCQCWMNIVFCHSIALTFTICCILTHCETGWLVCGDLVLLQAPVQAPQRIWTTAFHSETGLTLTGM